MKGRVLQFQYPFRGTASVDLKPTLGARITNAAKAPFDRFRRDDDDRGVILRREKPEGFRALSAHDFPLIFLTHNDLRFMPSFFAHYRAMGVTRFICVDDASNDGTRDFLLRQADADVYSSNTRYREARRGKIWREQLIRLYGLDRWYLMVDSDEYFLYESFPEERIGDYTRRLETLDIRRVAAPMLDLYPAGDIKQADFSGRDGMMPWQIATHLDGEGYNAAINSNALSIRGGVRRRVFGAEAELIKYPLARWDRLCSFGRSIHWPRPARYNFSPVLGAMLHFKIFSDVRERAQSAVAEGQHYDGSKIYRQLLDRLDGDSPADLTYAHSVRYDGPGTLLERGFLRPLGRQGR